MALGMIHRLIRIFEEATAELGIGCSCENIEATAILVHRIMSLQSRQFHTLEHVFGFLEDSDALTALSAVFHDIVYYQVDDGLQPELRALIDTEISESDGKVYLRSADQGEDRYMLLCRRVFGFSRDAVLNATGGLNEFLSALIMTRLLGKYFNETQLLAAIVCIEASIPFRGTNAEGLSMAEVLEKRLIEMRNDGLIFSKDSEIHEMITRAVAFANHDVQDFALEDPTRYLNNTWKLLPELNSALRNRAVFSIKEYRVALVKMLGFFQFLVPEVIFHSFQGIPDQASMDRLQERAKINLSIARKFMLTKILATVLIEAIADETGGDVPLALFMGDIPDGQYQPDRLDQYLPTTQRPPWHAEDDPVYLLLNNGRMEESSFDLKNSALALYLYSSLVPEAFDSLNEQSERYYKGQIDARSYLKAWDPAIRNIVIKASLKMVRTRKRKLEALLSL